MASGTHGGGASLLRVYRILTPWVSRAGTFLCGHEPPGNLRCCGVWQAVGWGWGQQHPWQVPAMAQTKGTGCVRVSLDRQFASAGTQCLMPAQPRANAVLPLIGPMLLGRAKLLGKLKCILAGSQPTTLHPALSKCHWGSFVPVLPLEKAFLPVSLQRLEFLTWKDLCCLFHSYPFLRKHLSILALLKKAFLGHLCEWDRRTWTLSAGIPNSSLPCSTAVASTIASVECGFCGILASCSACMSVYMHCIFSGWKWCLFCVVHS